MEAPGVLSYHYPLFMPAFMPAASSFFVFSYTFFLHHSLPASPRDRSGEGSRYFNPNPNPNPNLNRTISPELYPFIYCLTILGVFYAATVGFYRCIFFRILFCTFYAAFIAEFSRFPLLNNTRLYL